MDKYIIIKVNDADSQFPPSPVRGPDGEMIWAHSNVNKIRRSVVATANEQFIGVTVVVSHPSVMTDEETEYVAQLFDKVRDRL